jgi:TolB-like protein/Tfp pilus assembly protein PilF
LGFGETAQCISEAQAAVAKALVLDHSLAEAQFALALLKFNYEREWTEAEKAFQRAIKLNPNYAESYEHYCMFLAVMERSDEAVAEGKRAIELAPLALKTSYIAGWGFWFAGQSDLAKEQGHKLLEMEPNFSGGYVHLGVSLWGDGAYQKSLIELETAVKLGGGTDIKMLLGLLYGMVGEREKANQLLTEFQRLDEQGIFTANHQAFIYAGLGEMDRAFVLLEQAAERHEGVLVFLKQFSSLFPEFHNDSRMTDLLNRIGLPTDKTNQTDESLEAQTVMLSTGEVTSEPPAKDLETENAETKPTTEPPTNAKSEIQKPKSKWWLFGLLSLIVFVGGFFGYKYFTPNKQIESIAVMPFVNESGNQDVEYLSDGMTETLINSLSQLPNLSVKARSSVFRYKGKELDPKKIASELNVQAILTGRVVQRGEQLTLSLELIDAQTENLIWSESYNRKQTDLVTLQSEIALDVSSKLKTKLSGANEAKVTKNYTANPEAYKLYLKGRFYWNKRTAESLKQAVEFYKQAIEIDPKYALAYSGLAESYVLFPQFSISLPKDSLPQAKAAALRALELDDSLAEAHTALGEYLNYFEWDRAGAEKEFRRAIELNPNYATAHNWLGIDLLAPTKRFDEAIAELKRAEELDPLSPMIGANLGVAILFTRQYDEAIAQYKRVLSLDPNFAFARFNLGGAFHSKGMYTEAITEYRKSLELSDNPFTKGFLALSLAKSGQRDEAIELLNQLKQESGERYIPSYAVAIVYIGLNEKEEAKTQKRNRQPNRRPMQNPKSKNRNRNGGYSAC